MSSIRFAGLLRSFALLTFLLSVMATLCGCNIVQQALCNAIGCGNNSPQDSPGSFSYFAIIDFTQGLPSACFLSSDLSCVLQVNQQLAAPLSSSNWSLQTGVTDGVINGTWSSPATNAANINAIHSSLLYVTTHGGIVNGQAQVCLRDCNGSAFGGTASFGPPTIPVAWNGPNWLIIDSCDAVQSNAGWEGVFGGSLHGVLGWNAPVTGLADSGLNLLAKLISGYDTALDAWEQASATTSDSTAATALIPSANAADVIESAGGPHFGSNGDTDPGYYKIVNGSFGAPVSTGTQSLLSAAPQAVYALVPEQMNESYWYSLYGGTSLPGTISHPTANENLYRDEHVLVDHYLASGGLLVSTERTGTAQGFSESNAYSYALSWIASNGGLPADAVLTFAGAETNSNLASSSTSTSEPYPNVVQYVFIWRHANSGIVGNDKIEVRVDDAGSLSWKTIEVLNPKCNCLTPMTYHTLPWVPVLHMHTYVRIWRSLGAPLSSYRNTLSLSPGSYALCSSDMGQTTSQALPCGAENTTNGRQYLDTQSGRAALSTE